MKDHTIFLFKVRHKYATLYSHVHIKAQLFVNNTQFSAMSNETPFCSTHPDNSWTSDAHTPYHLSKSAQSWIHVLIIIRMVQLNGIKSVAALVLLDSVSFERLCQSTCPHIWLTLLFSLMKQDAVTQPTWKPGLSLLLESRIVTVSIATKLTLILSRLNSPGLKDSSVFSSYNNEEHVPFNDGHIRHSLNHSYLEAITLSQFPGNRGKDKTKTKM